MKNKTLLFLFSLFTTVAMAQQNGRVGNHPTIGKWVPSTSITSNFTSSTEGAQIARQIIDVVGLNANLDVRESSQVPNAAAIIYGGRRYVLYNGNFINQLIRTTGTKWAATSVLAHEIGHHLNGHTITAGGSQPAIELEADEFSGFVLRKMGATLAEAQAAMKTLPSATASRTHPAQYDRLASIATGWNKAGGQTNRSYGDVADNKPQPRPQTPPQTYSQPTQQPATVTNQSQIVAAINFKADPNSNYYVTSKYNVVKVKNNQVTVVGRLAKSNSSAYPYLIYDNDTKLYVHSSGAIVNANGRNVGTLSAA